MRGEIAPRDSPPELVRVLLELQHVQRALIERRFLRHTDGLERVRKAVHDLSELSAPAGVIARAAQALGSNSEFDRVIVSRLDGTALEAVATWSSLQQRGEDDHALAALTGRSMELGYPLVEAEVVRRRAPAIVDVAETAARALPGMQKILGWEKYVVTAIELEGKPVGLLHASRDRVGPPLDDVDLELVKHYADGLARSLERAFLRDRLERQRHQLEAAAQWIAAQTTRLSTEEAEAAFGAVELAQMLTQREFEVLGLIARGLSNRAIATSLLLAEGTIKYHVKNILRKLQVRSRAEAASLYVRGPGAEAS